MNGPRKKAQLPAGITRLKTGRYQARVRFPRDPLKGTRGGVAQSFGTQSDALAWLVAERQRVERGERVGRGSTTTLRAFLVHFYEKVRESTRGGALSPRTCAIDLVALDTYVFRRAPSLADLPMHKLPAAVPEFRQHFRDLAESGLARATVGRVHRVLRARLAFAVADGMLRENPMDNPRIVVSGKHKKRKAVLSAEQATALLEVCPGSRIGAFVATLIWSGGRPGEIAGLLHQDVDLDRRVIHIRRALVRVKPTAANVGAGVSWSLNETKTRSERTVPIPDGLVDLLRQHRVEQIETQLAAGRAYENHGLVFATDFGRPYFLDVISARYLKPLLRSAAVHLHGETPLPLPPPTRAKAYTDALAAFRAQEARCVEATAFPMGVGFYSCRHSYGSRLSNERVPLRDIMDLMGHKTASVTLDSYLQSTAESHRRALETLESSIAPKVRIGPA